jgi:hypothetical protein
MMPRRSGRLYDVEYDFIILLWTGPIRNFKYSCTNKDGLSIWKRPFHSFESNLSLDDCDSSLEVEVGVENT